MSVEDIGGKSLAPKEVSLRFGPITKTWASEEEFVASMLTLEQAVYDNIRVNLSGRVAEQIASDIEKEYLHAEYWTHKSHSEGRVAAKGVRIISEKTSNLLKSDERLKIVAPAASSIASGHQHSILKLFHEKLKPKMEEDGLEITDFTRDVDGERFGLERNLLEYEELMKLRIRDGYGLGLWPEATVKGGRKRKDGKGIYGMQPFQRSSIRRMARLAEDEGKLLSLTPVGLSKTHILFSPDSYMPPKFTILRTMIPFLPNVGAVVKVGMPVRWNELQHELKKNDISPNNDDAINDYLGRRLAALVPPPERGVYK